MRKQFGAAALAVGLLVTTGGCTSPSGHPPAAASRATHSVSVPASTPAAAPSSTVQATLPPNADHGPRGGAEGTVVLDDAGNPAAYVVAAGDNLSSIAERFGISVDDLVSRAEAYGAIHPGDELNLVGW